VHIAEGVLPASTLVAGAVLAAAGTAIGLRTMNEERTVKVAVLSSALFVCMLIHVPIGPAASHLILNGLAGLLLGWAAFPAILVALLLQAIFFGYGGLTTLGVNTLNMAFPAVCCYYAFGHILCGRYSAHAFAVGTVAGATAVVGAALLLGLSLLTAGREFAAVGSVVFLAHLPVFALEAAVTGAAVSFLRRVRPETFHNAITGHEECAKSPATQAIR
jgi:cobalt/nickel transport system permease protein